MKTFFAYAQLVRLPNAFTAMADICLGALVMRAFPEHLGTFACLLAASVFLYSAGMVWNDVFDIEQDLRERPFRPIPSGRIGRGRAKALGWLLLILGVLSAVAADLLNPDQAWRCTILAGLIGVAVFLYDGWLKRTVLGPWSMALCRFLNVLLGLSVTNAAIPIWGYLLALTVFFYIAGVTWFAKTEARMSNQNMLLAAALVMLASLGLALTAPPVAQEEGFLMRSSPAYPYLLACFGIYLALKVVPAVRNPRPDKVQPAVKRAVLGLVLLDAVLAIGLIGWWGGLIAALLVPALLLGKWIYST